MTMNKSLDQMQSSKLYTTAREESTMMDTLN